MITEVDLSNGGDMRVLVASFDTMDGADLAAKKLLSLEEQNLLDVDNTATVIKNTADHIDVKNVSDAGGEGAVKGALIGGIIGLIFPPSILVSAVIGAGVGAVAAKLRESGFDLILLQEMAESMERETSMLVAVVEPRWRDEVEAALAGDAHRIAWAVIDRDSQSALGSAGDQGETP